MLGVLLALGCGWGGGGGGCGPAVRVTPAGEPGRVVARVRLGRERPPLVRPPGAREEVSELQAALRGWTADDGWRVVPLYRVPGQGPYIPVGVRASPVTETAWTLALVDTGATFEARISEALAERLALARAEAPPVVLVRAFSRREVTLAHLEELEIAGASIGAFEAPVGTAGPEPLAIGMAALSRFRSVIFDWDRNRLLVAPWDDEEEGGRDGGGGGVGRGGVSLDRWRADPRWLPLPSEIEMPTATRGGRVFVRGSLAGEPVTALADTGYTGGLLVPAAGDVPGLRARVGVAFLSDRVARSPRRLLLRIGALRLGPLVYDGVPVSIADAAWFTPETGRPVLGMRALGVRPVWFDFERGVVRVWISERALGMGGGGRRAEGKEQMADPEIPRSLDR